VVIGGILKRTRRRTWCADGQSLERIVQGVTLAAQCEVDHMWLRGEPRERSFGGFLLRAVHAGDGGQAGVVL
jgi:hypothetical protein